MMFTKLGAAVFMATNPEKTKAMYTGKDYTGSGANSAKDMKSFRRAMKAFGYGFGEEDE